MKKIVTIFILLVISFFTLIFLIVDKSNNNFNEIKKRLIKNTAIKEISYLNQYDGYYLVMDKDYLYVIDNKYKELLRIERILIYDNSNNYDIIYRDKQVMYMSDYLKNGKLVYKYYDLYTYKPINEIALGG